MARGWESKSVEAQIESASEPKPGGKKLTPEEMERTRQRESLDLSRRRVLHDLKTARDPRYLEILQRGLETLEERIKKLGG
jgi:hypothetical protein